MLRWTADPNAPKKESAYLYWVLVEINAEFIKEMGWETALQIEGGLEQEALDSFVQDLDSMQ
jgi:hypothetical protein